VAAADGFLMLGQVLRAPDLGAIACVALASAGASVSARRVVTAPGALESA